MNFQEFYNKTENRLTDAILSLWATGDKEMQDYFKFLLSKEPIIAEAVFQNTFPWEQGKITFEQTTTVFKKEFIEALHKIEDPDFQFPKDRKPYKHQLKSWEVLLNQKKSIAVTTGTGSGKTECFMLPVLQDVYENHRDNQGINAIFLYPLNALIASQRKRMHAWSSALGTINYALLTGNTPNKISNKTEKDNALPQLISREQIRKNPPPILFTNPTMLEYMLVRNADTSILEKSQGSLKWIILDEAHTLTGSKAAEMALLIRRVVTAFGVDIEDLRFAITSATVGSGNTDNLKKFMSDLCGIEVEQIEVIQGKRVNNQIKDDEIPNLSEILSKNKIKLLRNDLLDSVGLSQVEIGKRLNITDKNKQLEAIDKLAEQKINNTNLLPVRGHFFTRGIGGVYVCTNLKCKEHKNKPNKALGTMYTIASKKCNCGHPLLELIACRSCGNMMLEGERIKNDGKETIMQKVSIGYEAFHIETEIENEKKQSEKITNIVRFIKNKDYLNLRNQELTSCSILPNNNLDIKGEDYLLIDDNSCPFCKTPSENPMHFRISSVFTNRILSDIVLDQTQNAKEITQRTLYNGRKYISFTDSRQGTAKIAALINIDSESDWVKYQTYHYLLKKLRANQVDNNQEELLEKRATYIKQLENTELPTFVSDLIKKDLKGVEKSIASKGENLKDSRTSWQEIIENIKSKNDFKTLFKKGAKGENLVTQNESYAKSLLFDQFARRLPRERSLENLGLINIAYPSLDDVVLPKIATALSINLEEWKSLLKIAADYVIRNNFHFFFEYTLFSSKYYRSALIYPSNTEVSKVAKWPSYNPKSITQKRLVLLICAGLGWHNKEMITPEREDRLNEFLEKIWRVLILKILTFDDNGYKLNFFEKTKFEIAGKEYLCPVTNRLIDKVFRGYSPWIKGSLIEENIFYYKIDTNKNIKIPLFTSPFHLNNENTLINKKEVEIWLAENSKEAREKGVWNNLHERIFDFDKLYLAGEHSAQQNPKRLKELEKQFEEGEINILSCSTTMEMGVDIGGISAVVMSNVPPMPANYLQRTGRAGRRSENKSLALTFCAPNPIGLRTMNNPKWALEHKIAPPILAFDSKNIVERHVNSLLFGIFIRSQDKKGLSISENIENFFLTDTPTIAENFLNWLDAIDHNNIKTSIKYLVKKTPLQNISTKQLILIVLDNFKKVKNDIKKQKNAFELKLEQLNNEFGNNSPAYKSVNYQKTQFLKKHTLNYLAEIGFLPNAGLPTGIVEFEKTTLSDLNKKNQSKFKANPSYSLTRALTEFAPGNSILIDGLNYKSAGVILKNNWGQSAERNAIQACKNCGYQRKVEIEENVSDNCPKCENNNSFIGISLGEHKGIFTELIEPAGFAIDLYSTPSRVISEKTKPQYLEPLLLNIDPWHDYQNSYLDFRTSEKEDNAEILFYNTGNGEGYSLCLDCGRVETSLDKLEGHRRLRGGKNNDNESACDAKHIRNPIILGSRFKTNFTEIRLKNSDNTFVNNNKLAYSLGVILTKSLAEHLAIEEAELGFGIKKYNGYLTIFIYDTAKGGAGYASQFSIYIKEILEQARNILSSCNCQIACTKCLVDRSSQWHIEDLDRHIAIEWLTIALNNQLPKDINDNAKVYPIFGSLNDEIKRQDYHFGIKEINIHVNHKISDWEIDHLAWLEKLKRNGNTVNIIVEGDIKYANNQEKLSTHLLSFNYALKKGKNTKLLDYTVHLSLLLENGNQLSYISKSSYPNLNEKWITNAQKEFYKVNNNDIETYSNLLRPTIPSNNFYESRVSIIPQGSQSNDLAKIMFSNLKNANDIVSKLKNRTFKVSYFDKFNQSEFSMRLLLQFINQIQKIFTLKVETLEINLNENLFKNNYRSALHILDNFQKLNDYKSNLKKLSENYDFKTSVVDNNKLPHYRYFNFVSDDFSFSIRIDGGIAHGIRPKEYLKSDEMTDQNEFFDIKKYVYHDIIYNISIDN